jgi:hypothetical protein
VRILQPLSHPRHRHYDSRGEKQIKTATFPRLRIDIFYADARNGLQSKSYYLIP